MSKLTMDLCQMNIILPAAATAAEQGAAEELREHIEKMCGVTLCVEREKETPAENKAIYIGNTRFAADCQVTFPDNKFGEGWAIKAVDGNLVLCGGKTRGALYAVYHLLEDVLGVHWWNIWEESIPTASEALVRGDYESSGVPAMEYRDVYAAATETDSRFFVRNRLNGFKAYAPKQYGGKEDFGEPAHIHTYDRYFPEKYTHVPTNVCPKWADALNPNKEHYFLTHPEWFAMTRRNRRMPHIFCMSNEGFQKAFADKLLKSIAYSYEKADRAGEARPRYFDVSPADMFGECACEKCRASIKKHGSSGHQLLFVNKMAEAVEEIYPEVRIDTVAYWHYIEPPKDDVRPRANVVIRFADNYMDLLHDIRHKNNEGHFRRLSAWSKLCAKGNLYFWDYGVVYGPGLFPSMYKLNENFQLFREVGVNGYFLEMENCIETDFWDMKVWMATKLMENPDLDQRALMDTFLDGYYGAASPYIRRYLDAMHQIAEENPGRYRFGAVVIRGDGLAVEDIIAANKEFDGAFAAVADDEVLLRRVYDARSGLDRVIFENYDRFAAEAAGKNLTLPVEKELVGRRLAENYTQQVALRGQWDETGEQARKQFERYLSGYVSDGEEKPHQTEHQRLASINGCANAWKGPKPQIVDESALDAYEADNLYIYQADTDFSTLNFYVLEDPDEPDRVTCQFDLGKARADGVCLDDNIMTKWAVEDNDPAKILPIGVYTGESDSEGAPLSNLWGSLEAKDILTDGKYHWYKFSDVATAAAKAGSVLHMFRAWELVIYTLPVELEKLQGKKLDFFLSMKVTGDITCRDSENLPVYSVDKLIVADKGGN